jgi:DNA polymerase III epsilon subunit family exonuclease
MKAKDTEYVVFDVETTGLSAINGDRIIEIAAMKIRRGKVVDTFESLINPQREVPAESQQVHKITPEMLASAPTAQDILPGIIPFIGGACLVGHNVKFDLDFLCHELSLIGRKLQEETPAVDTLKMAKYLLPVLSSHRLAHVAHALGIQIEETHRALADVQLTVAILIRLIDRAQEQDIQSFPDFYKLFGVQKPNFKIEQLPQPTLF